MKPRVLIVDDEKNIRRTLSMILKGAGYAVREAGSGEEAMTQLDDGPSEVVLLDVGLPGQDGLETLKQIQASRPGTGVIMISGQATVEIAVEATRLGAFDFLEKPLAKDRVLIAVRNACERSTLGEVVGQIQRTEAQRRAMIGDSATLRELRDAVAKVGPTGATVLLTGESGSGKELVARAVHEASPRKDGPFIKVNCAAIPEELIETELFGCIKGAYTGADRNRDGKFMAADGGTLFLDEIGDMSLKVQAKVLRALQEREIERVGDAKTIRVDVRVVTATNKNLMDEVEEGRFREDLFYRLNVVPLAVPPLRDRTDDIPKLAQHFIELYAAENDLPVKVLSPDAVIVLQDRRWRGNIRELRNVIERLAIMSDGPTIGGDDVARIAPEPGSVRALPSGSTARAGAGGSPATTAGAGPAATSSGDVSARVSPGWTIPGLSEIQSLGGLVSARREFERRCIEAGLQETGGNVSQAARLLGVERSNLHKKMQAHGLDGRSPEDGP